VIVGRSRVHRSGAKAADGPRWALQVALQVQPATIRTGAE
jgi:hypothetical protein